MDTPTDISESKTANRRKNDHSRIRDLASQLTRDRHGARRKHRVRRLLTWGGIIMLLGLGYVLWRVYRPVQVSTVVVAYQRVGSAARAQLRLSGIVTYPRIATISSRSQAPVNQLPFEVGDHVTAGAVLAVFDHRELLASRRVQEITLEDLESSLQRVQNLYEGGAASERELQSIRTQLALARANLGLLHTQIENSVIRAPFSGIIIRKMAEVGEMAAQGICQLADDSHTLVAVDVNQQDISKITLRSSAVVSLDAYPETEYAAAIYEIMPAADPAKNTIEVKVRLLNPSDRFKPNMNAKIFFTDQNVTENSEVEAMLTVDRNALIQEGEKVFVFSVEDGIVRKREVETGISIGDHLIEVRSGIERDRRVVLNPGQYPLNPGDRVASQ